MPKRMKKWAEERGVLVKSIEDAALAMACVLRSVESAAARRKCRSPTRRSSAVSPILLAQFMPFDLVIDETDCRRPSSARFEDERVRQIGAPSPVRCAISPIATACRARPSKARKFRIERLRRYAKRAHAELIYDAQRAQHAASSALDGSSISASC